MIFEIKRAALHDIPALEQLDQAIESPGRRNYLERQIEAGNCFIATAANLPAGNSTIRHPIIRPVV